MTVRNAKVSTGSQSVNQSRNRRRPQLLEAHLQSWRTRLRIEILTEHPMSLPRILLAALGVERSRPPGIDADAFGHLTGSQMNERPRAACFPRDDRAFAEHVRVIFDGPRFEPFAAAVQALLRDTYPLAVISPRHELAALDGALVWYAFRDGSAVPDVDRETTS